MTSKKLLIRDVPERIHGWIETERSEKKQTQKEFLLKILEDAQNVSEQLELYEKTPAVSSAESQAELF